MHWWPCIWTYHALVAVYLNLPCIGGHVFEPTMHWWPCIWTYHALVAMYLNLPCIGGHVFESTMHWWPCICQDRNIDTVQGYWNLTCHALVATFAKKEWMWSINPLRTNRYIHVPFNCYAQVAIYVRYFMYIETYVLFHRVYPTGSFLSINTYSYWDSWKPWILRGTATSLHSRSIK